MRRVVSDSKLSRIALVLGALGMVLHLIVGMLYLASGLVVEYPWVFGMWAIWVAGLILLAIVFRRRPAWTPAVPVAAVIIWVIVVQLGHWLLGWTA